MFLQFCYRACQLYVSVFQTTWHSSVCPHSTDLLMGSNVHLNAEHHAERLSDMATLSSAITETTHSARRERQTQFTIAELPGSASRSVTTCGMMTFA